MGRKEKRLIHKRNKHIQIVYNKIHVTVIVIILVVIKAIDLICRNAPLRCNLTLCDLVLDSDWLMAVVNRAQTYTIPNEDCMRV